MAATELGAYYITVMPSLQGAKRQIESQLSGINTSKVGDSLGKQLSGSLVKSLDLTSIGSKLQSVGKSISGVGATLTSKITKPALVATTAVGGLVTALGFKRLVGIDTARGQFKGLGYDADAVMKQVDAGVTNTALSMAEGASAAVSILATGAVPLEGLEAQIKRVANVSAAYGVDASHANYLLNSVLTKQKVTWGDLSQMQQNNIPVVTALADTFGYTGEQIQEMAEKGEISIDMLNEALDNKAGAAALEYANTWKGVTANILSNLGKLGAKFLEPSFEIVKAKAADFLAFLKTPEFSDMADRVGQSLASGLQTAIDTVQRLIDWWQKLSPATQKAIGVFAGVTVAAGPVLSIFGKITSVIGAFTGGIGKLVEWVGRLAPGMTAAGSGAGGLLKTLGRFAGPVGIAITAIAALWTQSEAFRNGLMQVGQAIWSVIQQVMTAVQPVIDLVMSTLMPIIGQVGDALGGLFAMLAPALGEVGGLLSGLIAAAMPVVDFLMGILAPAFEHIKNVVQVVFDALGPIISAATQVISGIITTFTAVLSGDWSAAWNGIRAVFEGVWNLITSVVTGAVNAVKGVIGSALSAIGQIWSNAWNGVLNVLNSVWSGIKSGVSNGISGMMSLVGQIPGKIMGFFSGAGSWLVDSGRAIIQGLIDGIGSMFGAIGDAMGGAMEWARSWLPFSPAKRGAFSGRGWTTYSGASIMEGLAEGISAKQSVFSNAVAGAMAQGDAAIRNLQPASLGVGYSALASSAVPAGGAGVVYNDNRNVYYPQAEPDSIQVSRVQQLIAAGGGLG